MRIALGVRAGLGFVGGASIEVAAMLGGLTNLATQVVVLNLHSDCAPDEFNWNADINWGSVADSSFGAGWGAAITRGMGPITSGIVAFKPEVASSALGTALGK